MPLVRDQFINEIEQRLNFLSERIKGFTGIGLNNAAKFLEPFAARLLNAVYGWNLSDPAPGVPNTKGIDLTDDANCVAVQVSVQESAEKIRHTVAMLSNGKLAGYTTIAVFFLHHIKHRKPRGLLIINIGALIGQLTGRDPSVLREVIAIFDSEIARWIPDTGAATARRQDYLRSLADGFRGYDELGLDSYQISDDASPDIWDIFVPPACSLVQVSPEEMEAAQSANPPTHPAQDLLPLLADEKIRRHVLLGDPGMGKSTLIQQLTAGLAGGRSIREAPALNGCIPVPFILRDIVPLLPDDPVQWTWETLCDTLRIAYHRGDNAPLLLHPYESLRREFRDEILDHPQAFFLIDGLDEIGDLAKRTTIRDAIQEGFRAHQQGRWLITSRVHGYGQVVVDIVSLAARESSDQRQLMSWLSVRDEFMYRWMPLLIGADRLTPADVLSMQAGMALGVELSIARVLYLAPFDNRRQDEFMRNWFRERKATDTTPGLLCEVRGYADQGIRVIARVPNLLCYMAMLKRNHKPLPDGRALLYEQIVQAYLEGIDRAYHLAKVHGHHCPIDTPDRLRLLALLAAEMQRRRGETEMDVETSRDFGRSRTYQSIDGNILISHDDACAVLVPAVARLLARQDSAALVEEFLGHIARRSGLLLPRGPGADGQPVHAFAHLSFLEFFAACYLREKLDETDNRARAASRPRFDADKWDRDHPPGPLTVNPTILASWASQPTWSETLFFLAELRAANADDLAILLEDLFSSLHSTEPVPLLDFGKVTVSRPLLPKTAASLAIRLARDQHLALPTAIRFAWFERLWDGWLAWEVPVYEQHPWPVSRLLLDRPAHEKEALAAFRSATTRRSGITTLVMDDCQGLTSIDSLPLSLTRLCLKRCTALNSVDSLPRYLTELWLNGCTGLAAVDSLPCSLTKLSLQGCTGLKAVDSLPQSLKELYLYGCTGLAAVDSLPQSLTKLSLGGCKGLTAVDSLPHSLKELNLSGCTGLAAVESLPPSLRTLYLNDCTGLATVDCLPQALTILYLDGCTGLAPGATKRAMQRVREHNANLRT